VTASVQRGDSALDQVTQAVARARQAQAVSRQFTQDQVDDVVRAVGWACFEETHAQRLASLSVQETGMGNEADRIVKVRRKALMMMRDLAGAPSVGVVSADPGTGLTRIAKPVGLVAALCPSTHPATDLMAKAMMVLKGRNAMVASPSPGAVQTSMLACDLIRSELERVGAPPDLLQVLPRPSKEAAAALMDVCDVIVVTGSARNVRAASTSGAPVYAGGAGNVPIVVEPTADLARAAADIARSKTFDYSTACSSESVLLIQESVYSEMLEHLRREGGVVLDSAGREALASVMWSDGRLNPAMVGRSPEVLARAAGLPVPAHPPRFFVVEEDDVGPGHRFSGEKMSVALAAYPYRTFADAVSLVQRVLDYQGVGHSCGIHTGDSEHARMLAESADVARVIVNQPQGTAEAGSFTNALPATMVLGCGTWAGNTVSGNVTYEHFLNYTHVAEPLPERVPTQDELWGDYLRRYH
jgi:sulfoacetaldehyde dehydrogenase